MFGSTPDQTLREQMPEVVKYVGKHFERKTVQIKESLISFIQTSHKGRWQLG